MYDEASFKKKNVLPICCKGTFTEVWAQPHPTHWESAGTQSVSQNLSTLNETKSLQLCSNIWWKAFPEAVTVGDTGFGITHTTIDSKCGCPRTFGHVSYIWENLIPLTGLRTVRCSLWSVYWPSSDQTMLVPLIYTEASCPHHISFYITKIIGSWTVASCKNLYILIMLENNLRLSFTALCITVSYDHFYSKI